MNVLLLENGEVQFETRILKTDEQSSEKNFDREVTHSDEVIVICSWCSKIKVDDGDWQEIEDSLEKLGLFELEVLPQSSHGMCDDCYETISERIKK